MDFALKPAHLSREIGADNPPVYRRISFLILEIPDSEVDVSRLVDGMQFEEDSVDFLKLRIGRHDIWKYEDI